MTELRRIREARGLCLAELAFRLNVSDGNLSKVERGWRKLPEGARKKAAELFDVEEAELFSEDGFAK